jgi:hypothetical protein
MGRIYAKRNGQLRSDQLVAGVSVTQAVLLLTQTLHLPEVWAAEITKHQQQS